jgi:hypothetical protein
VTIERHAVQLAASAAALVEDCQRPASPPRGRAEGLSARKWWDPGEMVLGMVRDERRRRAEARGNRRRLPLEWLMLLAVEAGDLAEDVRRAAAPEGAAREACDDLLRAAASARRWLAEQETPSPPPPAGRADPGGSRRLAE